MKKQKLIQFSTEELNTIIRQIFKEKFKSLKEIIYRRKILNYLSKKDIAKIYPKDISIINDWRKPVYFKNYQIYIKASEIKSLMIKLEK